VIGGGTHMDAWSGRRVSAALAMAGGLLALVGNALAPRFNGDDVANYQKIADSTRYAVAGVIVLAAVLLVSAAFAGINRFGLGEVRTEISYFASFAVSAGAAIAVLQTGVALYGYKQQARAFDGANAQNVVSAFWATNALDHLSSAMFAAWTIVLLGLAPALIGAAQLRAGVHGRLGLGGVIGGAVCLVVGVASLLTVDQSTYDVPFVVGSVIVTIWLIVTGVLLWRLPRQQITA